MKSGENSRETMRKVIGVRIALAGRNTFEEFFKAGTAAISSVVDSSEDVVVSSSEVVASVSSVVGEASVASVGTAGSSVVVLEV